MAEPVTNPFAKYSALYGLAILGALLFAFWRFAPEDRREETPGQPPPPPVVPVLQGAAAKADAAPGQLLLVDNDLYQLETGERLFTNWLKKDAAPQGLFYDEASKKIIARYEDGFTRHTLNGTEEATLGRQAGMITAGNPGVLFFAKAGDLWTARPDFHAFKLTGERKVTSAGIFDEQQFTANTLLCNGATLLWHRGNEMLHVNVGTGAVQPMAVSPLDIPRRRSPDGKWVMGLESQLLYCYDVDDNAARKLHVGPSIISDYQWIGNDRCALLLANATVSVYDRRARALQPVVTLPEVCHWLIALSPDGRYVFGANKRRIFLVDLQEKKIVPAKAGRGLVWTGENTFLFSRDSSAPALRGTWRQTVGGEENRVSAEPYAAEDWGRGSVSVLPSGLAAFASSEGLMRLKPGGTEAELAAKLEHPPSRMMIIGEWKVD